MVSPAVCDTAHEGSIPSSLPMAPHGWIAKWRRQLTVNQRRRNTEGSSPSPSILPYVRVGEEAVLKTVGPKGLAGSNPVYGV